MNGLQEGLEDPCLPGSTIGAVTCRAGDPAFPFRLKDAGGRVHTLEAHRGAWVLLVLHRHLR